MKKANTYVDTLGIRCECEDKYQRDNLFESLVNYLKEKNIVGIKYDDKHSNMYYRITNLLYGNSKLGAISKGYYKIDRIINADYYYINFNFYGLKRYGKNKEDASQLLIRTIAAYLNTHNINFRLTELDIAIDIHTPINNMIAVCLSRSPNIDYYELGSKDKTGQTIQDNGTYYIEHFKSNKQRKNAMSRAYLYNKREKELTKFKRDIGFELTRFEVKFQKRWFVKNNYGIVYINRALKKYAVLEFKDSKHKEEFIKKFNRAKTAKKRKMIVNNEVESKSAILHAPQMHSIGTFLREIDTVTSNYKGEFSFIRHEDYIECASKFNNKMV